MPSLYDLKRAAKALRRAHAAGDALALQRLRAQLARQDLSALKHADYLHVIAREHQFASWPRLKLAAETEGMDRAQRQQRLRVAVFEGQAWVVEALLDADPTLPAGDFGLACALYDVAAVSAVLAQNPDAALLPAFGRPPLCHLAFSRWIKARPDLEQDMMAVAQRLVAQGADVDAGFPAHEGSDHRLSPLYGAIGHADNMVLGRWLLEQGATPNDNESLYHATELGHHEGLRLLLAHGADPKGTNALLRAMDFHDHRAVRLLLDHGARADDFDDTEIGGEAPWTAPALHQAARRGCDARMVDLLLEAGADPQRVYGGASAYAYARVFGHGPLAAALEARGAVSPLTREEALLADVAEGRDTAGRYLDPERLAPAYRDILRTILHLPDRLPHVRRLVSVGVEYDRPDTEGLTPVQVAGWEGLPDVMAYVLSLKPDLTHVNGYGGTLLSTILHGSENAPDRETRDHIGCLRLALRAGVALPQRMIDAAGREDVAAFLEDWAVAHPGHVV